LYCNHFGGRLGGLWKIAARSQYSYELKATKLSEVRSSWVDSKGVGKKKETEGRGMVNWKVKGKMYVA